MKRGEFLPPNYSQYNRHGIKKKAEEYGIYTSRKEDKKMRGNYMLIEKEGNDI